MTNQTLANAEKAGKHAYHSGEIPSYAAAERFAIKNYSIMLEREWFVAGWNQAFWDEQERVLSESRIKTGD